MPGIFDILDQGSRLLPALQDTFALSSWGDLCGGYFNLRGWGGPASYVDQWEPAEKQLHKPARTGIEPEAGRGRNPEGGPHGHSSSIPKRHRA